MGWPGVAGSLGPMTRTVGDLAVLLDALVGYDPEDPITALGIGRVPASYTSFLDRSGLKGARIGVLREPMGLGSEPESEDFKKVSRVFDEAVDELKKAGATLVDPVEIPGLNDLLAKRSSGDRGGFDQAWEVYFARSAKRPFKSFEELLATPGYSPKGVIRGATPPTSYEHLLAREELMLNILKLMADHQLDAIAHNTVEHQPILISEGVNPPYTNTKGAPHLNTFLVYVPSVTVPAGFTSDKLPAGITFLGRPYSDGTVIKLAYAYEQATMHRRPPSTTPALPGEPRSD